MPNFFQRIELSLSERHLSKGALAAHLQVALSTISRWKKAIPRAETIIKTASLLGVDAKWLMTGEGEMYPVKIGEKKPGDVFRSGEGNDFSPPYEKNLPVPQVAYASAKEVHDLRDSVADLRDQVLVLNRMVATLLHQSPPQEGAMGAKKAGSVSLHRRAKVQSDNPSLSPDAWLIDRDERGGDHDD